MRRVGKTGFQRRGGQRQALGHAHGGDEQPVPLPVTADRHAQGVLEQLRQAWLGQVHLGRQVTGREVIRHVTFDQRHHAADPCIQLERRRRPDQLFDQGVGLGRRGLFIQQLAMALQPLRLICQAHAQPSLGRRHLPTQGGEIRTERVQVPNHQTVVRSLQSHPTAGRQQRAATRQQAPGRLQGKALIEAEHQGRGGLRQFQGLAQLADEQGAAVPQIQQ